MASIALTGLAIPGLKCGPFGNLSILGNYGT